MKNTLYNLLGAAVLLVVCAFSTPSSTFSAEGFVHGRGALSPSSIKGRVNPADGATEVVAVSATDSVRAVITDGMFILESKPGTYKLIVVAKPPYKNVVKDNVQVAEGNATDVGTITLQE
jgi:hypothetical protein